MEIELKQKKILLVSNSFGYGGKEKVLLDLAHHFPSFQFQPLILILSRLMGRAVSVPEAMMIVPRFTGDWQPALRIRKIIKQNKIHSIICFDIFSYFNVRLAVLYLQNKPQMILSLHNSDFTARKKEMLHAWLWRILLTKEDKIVAICNYQADFYAKIFFINKSRFAIIYNGVDVDYYARKSPILHEAICSHYQLSSSKTFIIQVAGLRIEKKHEDSLRALRIIKDTYDCNDVALLIVGGGTNEYEQTLREFAYEIGVENSVYFLGNRVDVRDFLSIATLFTLSSVEIETFSIATLEAMAFGLPCVLTRVGGAEEMIIEGFNGYTVPPHNPEALAEGWYKVLQNRGSFSSEEISHYVKQKYSIEKCTASYSKIINQQ